MEVRCSPPSPAFFSPDSGIYHSKHSPVSLPHTDLVSYIFSHAHGGVTALVDARTGSSIAYADLRRMVSSLASGLKRIGITGNDVVLVMLPNSVLFPIIVLGVISAGAVFSSMNPLSSQEEIKKQMKQCRASLIMTASDNVPKVRRLGVRIVAVPDESKFDAGKFALFKNLISTNPDVDAPRSVIRQTDTAAILFSSGTTGASKGVILTHGNLIAAVGLFVRFECSQYDRESWRDVYLAAIPMFHVYGLALFSMGLLSVGSTIVVMRRFDAEEAVRLIDGYKVTHFPVVPPIMASLVRAKRTTGSRLQSLIQVSSGAAPVSQKSVDDFLGAYPHVDFIQGYGLTESAAVGARGFNTLTFRKNKSVGLLAPNMKAKIIDIETGLCLPPGSSGELLLQGPGIMKGYLNDENATSSTIVEDGWLKTGDIAYFDQDGYLYIIDRLKETIKYKGFQISPADLEAIMITHPEVADVAVTSAKNEEAGEVPVAFIVRSSGSNLSAKDVMEFVAKQVAPYKKVRKVVFVNSIPRSAAGKILRRELRGDSTSRM
ncbi:4-coumarate--CoA ligase-like 6 [Canna indica]|uniref:4-coumarate--CoA ligase n=1 Tax=Canna indica TaxID=4628 RepID=A0AAQ3KLW8_9LILI|nr:4-coumarate--CoA ligase-like 6 [Canna indica]